VGLVVGGGGGGGGGGVNNVNANWTAPSSAGAPQNWGLDPSCGLEGSWGLDPQPDPTASGWQGSGYICLYMCVYVYKCIFAPYIYIHHIIYMCICSRTLSSASPAPLPVAWQVSGYICLYRCAYVYKCIDAPCIYMHYIIYLCMYSRVRRSAARLHCGWLAGLQLYMRICVCCVYVFILTCIGVYV